MEHSADVAIAPVQNIEASPLNANTSCADGKYDQEQVQNDLTLELMSREVVYVPRGWVSSKLDQIKTTSSLSVVTKVIPESVKITRNILSMEIGTAIYSNAVMELHFFEDGIIKLNCVNPVNPSKFSFELVDKPVNLAPYSIAGKVTVTNNHADVEMTEAQLKVIVKFNPFTVTLISTRNNTQEVLLEINNNKSLRFDENLAADFSFNTEYLYGLPERAVNLLLEDTKKGLPYRFYNQDIPAYPVGSKNSLYAAVPVMIGRSKNSSSLVSMYWQNTSDTYIDIHRTNSTTQTYWLSERGNLECYVFASHSPVTHFKALSNILGHCAMPQYFALGYHQCRWSYNDQQDALHVNEKFNEHEIPCDSITLDIDHTDGCRYFTWNENLFPDPLGLQAILVKDGRQLVTIADPHIKCDDNYHVYQEALAKDLCIKTKDNENFVGKCWPGQSIYLDYLNEQTRENWASQYSYEKYKYSTPNIWAWNDMNEPSVFEIPGNHMPVENLHTFKSNADPTNTFQVEHREVHNIYGYLQHKATYDGLIKRNKCQNIRPHVLSRSFFAGSQKYTTIWTGDTGSTWEYLKITIPQMLSLSLCGISNCGGDVGGFVGDPEPELAIRWYQLGIFMPYFRGHSAISTKRREPWLYEKKYADLIKESIKERYRLLAYWYNCFEEHCRTGVPILRPIWFAQEKVLEEGNMHDQERFMVGDALLVVPILESGKTSIKGVLRGLEGRWYDYYSKKEVTSDEEEIKTGLERIGCFVKGGSVVPVFDVKSYVKSSKDAKESNIHLYVALDEKENAKGTMYADDGETFDYKKGAFTRKNIEFSGNTLSWHAEVGGNEYDITNRITKTVFMGADGNKFQNAYLVEEGKKAQKIRLVKAETHLLLEFVTLANKNWKIVLE